MGKDKEMLNSLGKTFIDIKDIEELFGLDNHMDIVLKIEELKNNGLLRAISGKTQEYTLKHPRLEKKYRILKNSGVKEVDLDVSKLKEEILYGFPCCFSTDYYLQNISTYHTDKHIIDTLLKAKNNGLLDYQISINERSYELFLDEKYLSGSSDVSKVCRRLGISQKEFLNYYETPEPFFYKKNCDKGDVLIVENKDTFFTLRKIFCESEEFNLFGVDVGLLIYGEGWKIISSIYDLIENPDLSSFMKNNSTVYYWGDVDREGISIYSELSNLKFPLERKLLLEAYDKMISLGGSLGSKSKKEQILREDSLSMFEGTALDEDFRKILKSNNYIPQEAVNYKIIKGDLLC